MKLNSESSDNGRLESEKVRRENERKSKTCEKEAAFFFFILFFQNKKKNWILNLNFIIKLDLIFYLFLWHLNFGVLAPTKFKPTFLNGLYEITQLTILPVILMAFKFRNFGTNQINQRFTDFSIFFVYNY